MPDKNRNMNRKAVFEPYDMDTANGTNNSGVLMFSPYLEDIDTVSSVISGNEQGGSNAPVYNAQDSVLWNNIRDAFRGELATMYRNLRASGAWSYEAVETRYKNHQAIWPEAIFNEDAWVKYIIPLVDPVTIDDTTGELIKTDRYLTMLQGSKEEQRKWWLYNRFRYLDSKYDTGNATANTINIRLFNSGTMQIKAAIPLYIAVSFGGGTTPVMKRTEANTVSTFPYVAETGVTEMETWIHSANLITDVGDLSQFYPNECDFSKAVLLKRLEIGNLENGYSNTNLTTIDVRNCQLLEYINCANCPRLGITVNLENSPRLVEGYFEGTAITGVDLADGCVIENLHLPGTITALTLLNLTKLTDLQVESYSNVSRIMLANMDQDIIDPCEVLGLIPASSQVNIQGLYLELENVSAITAFYDILDTMTGVTRERSSSTGEWIYHEEENPVISGVIHVPSILGSQFNQLTARYPYVDITADQVTSYLYYYNYDGSQLLYTETIYNGADGAYSASPSRASSAQYDYTFIGWNTQTDQAIVDANATKNVIGDRNIYAAYSRTVRTYTVRFMNGASVLQIYENVPYGGSATYTGATPVHSEDPTWMQFIGWDPDGTNIIADTDCQPVWLNTNIKTRKIINRTISGSYENSLATSVGPYAFAYCTSLTTVSFPAATTIGSHAFTMCEGLSKGYFPEVTTIENGAFENCSLTTLSTPKVKTLGSEVFYFASIASVSMPELTTIGSWAFDRCAKLSVAYFPSATTMGKGAFDMCLSLHTASFPVLTETGVSAFTNCSRLTTISFPELKAIPANMFSGCYRLTTAVFPKASEIYGLAFNGCFSLVTAEFPAATSVASMAFSGCTNLTTVSLPVLSSFNDSPFRYACSRLTTLVVGTGISTVCKMNSSDVLSSTYVGTSFTVYVPDSLVTSYKTATNWTYYSSHIKGISELSV